METMIDLDENSLDRTIAELSIGEMRPIDPAALEPRYISATYISAMASKINQLVHIVNIIDKSLKELLNSKD